MVFNVYSFALVRALRAYVCPHWVSETNWGLTRVTPLTTVDHQPGRAGHITWEMRQCCGHWSRSELSWHPATGVLIHGSQHQNISHIALSYTGQRICCRPRIFVMRPRTSNHSTQSHVIIIIWNNYHNDYQNQLKESGIISVKIQGNEKLSNFFRLSCGPMSQFKLQWKVALDLETG